jgi:hypothetical protein
MKQIKLTGMWIKQEPFEYTTSDYMYLNSVWFRNPLSKAFKLSDAKGILKFAGCLNRFATDNRFTIEFSKIKLDILCSMTKLPTKFERSTFESLIANGAMDELDRFRKTQNPKLCPVLDSIIASPNPDEETTFDDCLLRYLIHSRRRFPNPAEQEAMKVEIRDALDSQTTKLLFGAMLKTHDLCRERPTVTNVYVDAADWEYIEYVTEELRKTSHHFVSNLFEDFFIRSVADHALHPFYHKYGVIIVYEDEELHFIGNWQMVTYKNTNVN